MKTPKVSVILPVYNAEKTLEAAALSILNQSLQEIELILFDDGSEDASPALIHKLAAHDPRVLPIIHPHVGVARASELAAQRAGASYIARMDADDYSYPERLERQSAFLDAHPETGLVSCQVEFGGDRERAMGYAMYVDWLNEQLHHEQISLKQFRESPIANPSVMFRKELIDAHGFYKDGDFPEDYELWLRWLSRGIRFEKCPDVLLRWNDPPGRLSRTDQRYAPNAFHRCKASYLAQWLEQHNPHHPRVMLWGAGRLSRRHSKHLKKQGIEFTHYIDIDPNKIGREYDDVPTIHQDDLPPAGECFVVSYISSRDARPDVKEHLLSRDYKEGLHYLFAS